MDIRIYDVGRRKMSTTISIPDESDADDVATAVYVAVRKMGALMSRDITTTWDEDELRGGVYAGGRLVGHAEYLLPESESHS